MPTAPSLQSRYRGALLGLAVGDALGTTLEFRRPGSFEPIDDLIGGGPFGLRPGEWTDDTSMALCLAESLVECGGFDAADQMRRYLRWYREGYFSCTGECFDIGNTVRSALLRFERGGDPYAGSIEPNTAGNGSLMRLAPAPLFFARDRGLAIDRAADSSRTTHGAAAAVDACRLYAGLIVDALDGASKADLTAPAAIADCCEAIAHIARGSFREKRPPQIRGTGYVVDSLEAALWAFHTTDTFEDGALAAVNLGDDADTTGAVYGQLAGAFYGVEGIPARWRGILALHDRIVELADALFAAAAADRA